MTADLALMARNRQLLAERTGWPPGVLATCEWLDARHPGWSVMWRSTSRTPGFEHPEGYVADRLGPGDVIVCATSVPELEAAIASAPDEVIEWWKRDKCCARRWSTAR